MIPAFPNTTCTPLSARLEAAMTTLLLPKLPEGDVYIPKTITVIGSLNVDLVSTTPRVPQGGETLTGTSFSTGPGGKGANQAVACARLARLSPDAPSTWANVKMVGAVGDDEFGPPLLKGMEKDSIDISGVRVLPGERTGVAVIIVEETTGENRILLNPAANHHLQPSDFLKKVDLGTPLPDLIILQLEIQLQTVTQILNLARYHNVPVLLNPAPAVKLHDDVYKGLAHLIVNEPEAMMLSTPPVVRGPPTLAFWRDIASQFLAKGVLNIVITLGANGAFWANRDGDGLVEAPRVERVVDTTAAGDTFVGAYAVNVAIGAQEKMGMDFLVRFACMAAGKTVEKEGAQSAIPWRTVVEEQYRATFPG